MEHLINLLSKGKTSFHLVDECKKIFTEMGFISPDTATDLSKLKPGKYIISPYSSMLIAFVMGDRPKKLRIATAHTDFPMLKLKCNPSISKKGYLQANIEPYGGLITGTWFDRPLGLAGKIVTKGQDAFNPQVHLFDSEKPIFIIPNLAPHLKKDGKGDLDIQKEMLPIMGMEGFYQDGKIPEDVLMSYIAEQISVSKDDILDYDLYLYVYQNPETVGINDEYLAAPRIDNISSVAAITEALCYGNTNPDCLSVGIFYDNEEIGSRSKQGADSSLVKDILSKLTGNMDIYKNGFNLSLDVAHGTHPNYPEKNDITNDIPLGGGVVLKSSASQRYVTDSEAGAVIIAICREKDIMLQRQVNRSGMPGGQTLGPIMSSYLPLFSCDLGIPMLAMHSACELVNKKDYKELVKLIKAYYEY